MKDFAKKALPDLCVIVGFIIIAVIYFITPLSDGLVLGGHDTVAGMGQGHEQQLFHEATGETTRWTNSIFSGMPTYQIAPSYGPTSLLGKIGWVLGLFTTGPLNYILVYLLGFYLLMRTLKLRPEVSALGSVLWAFSSYFFIIIAAGHIWKVNTLGYIPPTIAGLILAYRGKYLWGLLVTALFTGLQVLSNHIQMTYYFLFPMAFIVIAYGVEAVKQARKSSELPAPTEAPTSGASAPGSSSAPTSGASAPGSPVSTSQFGGFGDDLKHSPLSHWLRATAAIIVGGLLGVAINLPNLYHTWDYSHYSMRGPSELTAASPATAAVSSDASLEPSTGGLDRDYITAWSYGIDETMTLLIPMYKGGGSTPIQNRDDLDAIDGYDEWAQQASTVNEATGGQLGAQLPGLIQYWGEQPMTVGPVYVGAIACFLFILALFLVRGPLKWAMLLATLVSLIFAWGRNIMPITDFLIDNLPMYNKFRTVSSALVVAEFTIPLLAVLGLAEVLRRPDQLLRTRRGQVGLAVSLTLTAGLALFFALVPSAANPISSSDVHILSLLEQQGLPADIARSYRSAILTMHGSILSASAWRSFWLVALAAAAVLAYVKWPKSVPAWSTVAILLVASLADMWSVNRQYLNDDNFQLPEAREAGFTQTPADKQILADKDPDFRVLNLSAGNPFNESDNHTAYWHKSIGGYHAAKLHRYQDLIDRYLNAETQALSAAISSSYNNIIGDSIAAEHFFTEAMANAPEGTDPEAFAQQQLYAEVMKSVVTDSVAPVLNMLNTKWVITGQGGAIALQNPTPNGNAWFLTDLKYVDTPNQEIAALKDLNLRSQAVAGKQFQQALGAPFATPAAAASSAAPASPAAVASSSAPASPAVVAVPSDASLGAATLTSYAPNALTYTVDSKQGGVVAFSEIYYPGWSATIDGQPAELGRVNYILRALRVPAGKHEVVLTFQPSSLTATNTVAYAALALLVLGFIAMTGLTLRRRKK